MTVAKLGTGVKVIDTSALAAVVFNELEADAVGERISGWRLVAPPLLVFEMANVCLTKIKRTPADAPVLRAALQRFEALSIDTHEVPAPAMLALAEATGLTPYDASYLWLARSLSCELVTLDRKLLAAAMH